MKNLLLLAVATLGFALNVVACACSVPRPATKPVVTTVKK